MIKPPLASLPSGLGWWLAVMGSEMCFASRHQLIVARWSFITASLVKKSSHFMLFIERRFSANLLLGRLAGVCARSPVGSSI